METRSCEPSKSPLKTKVIVEQKKLEGFDLIFTRIPEISLYQILLFIGASYTIIVSGQVQTGSVFLNAKPEQYRCKNKLDSFPDATYQNAHFASADKRCYNWDIDWLAKCPNASTVSDFENCAQFNSLLNQENWKADATCSPCDEYIYSPNNTFTQTVITQFDWVCDTSVFPMNSISTSIFMAGLLAGALGFGNLSDRIGRRNGLLVAMLCGFISNLALYFVNDPITFTAVRFLSGGFAHACVIVSYVYVMEFLGPQGRTWLGCQHLQLFAIGYISLSLIAYYARDWHNMQLIISLCTLPFFLIYFFLPTSARWLYSKNRNAEARQVLLKLSDKTGGEMDESFLSMFEEKIVANQNDDDTHYTSLDLMKPKQMRKITFIMLYCWFVTSMIYYGLGLNAGALSGNIFENNALNGIFDMLSKIVAPICLQTPFLGRRGSLALMFFIGGVSCIGAMLLNLYSNCDHVTSGGCMADIKNEETCNMMMKHVSRWLAFIGKFASSALFTIVYTYSAELYPTCVRGSALGLASAGGRIGGAISPLIFGIDDTLPWFSNTFFGLSSIIAAGMSFWLPETMGKPMTQTIEEAESSYYSDKQNGDYVLVSQL